jgi:hypothetical protein
MSWLRSAGQGVDIPITQREAGIEPDRAADEFKRETMTFEEVDCIREDCRR